MGLIAKEMKLDLGIWLPDKVFEEIRKNVHGYDVSKTVLDLGAAATAPLNGRVAALPGVIRLLRRHSVHFRVADQILEKS